MIEQNRSAWRMRKDRPRHFLKPHAKQRLQRRPLAPAGLRPEIDEVLPSITVRQLIELWRAIGESAHSRKHRRRDGRRGRFLRASGGRRSIPTEIFLRAQQQVTVLTKIFQDEVARAVRASRLRADLPFRLRQPSRFVSPVGVVAVDSRRSEIPLRRRIGSAARSFAGSAMESSSGFASERDVIVDRRVSGGLQAPTDRLTGLLIGRAQSFDEDGDQSVADPRGHLGIVGEDVLEALRSRRQSNRIGLGLRCGGTRCGVEEPHLAKKIATAKARENYIHFALNMLADNDLPVCTR